MICTIEKKNKKKQYHVCFEGHLEASATRRCDMVTCHVSRDWLEPFAVQTRC